MRGHEDLIAMRRAGKRPADGVVVQVWDRYGRSRFVESVIEVDERDDPERIDLRFLVGLRVVVTGEPEHSARVAQFVDAAIKAKASGAVGMVSSRCDGISTHRVVSAVRPWGEFSEGKQWQT